jgi:hypothetical protein
MRLSCPDCGKQIPAADVNLELALAKCAACDAVFEFLDRVERVLPPLKNTPPPKRVQVERIGPDLILTRRWWTWSVCGLIVFCVFWDGFLVIWYSAVINALVNGQMGAAAILPLVFPVIHVSLGAWLTYACLAMLLNRSVIEASKSDLSIRHGPLPWPGNRVLGSDEIEHVFCTDNERRLTGNRSQKDGYGVWLRLTDGKKAPVVRGLAEPDEACYIAQTLASHLGVKATLA